jgi:L-histidine N-alpha-methyltransferase
VTCEQPASNPIELQVRLSEADLLDQLRRDATVGLSSTPRRLSPIWFYDKRGSELFDEITRLPSYYLTRAEASLLEAHSEEVARRCRAATLVELGSGTCDKTHWLVDSLLGEGSLIRYVPFDVDQETLVEAASEMLCRHPGLRVSAIVGDFHEHLSDLPCDGPRLIAFLGSTIGNLLPDQRRYFFQALRATMHSGDWFLLGADLLKDEAVLRAAYDDPEGITGCFNRNALSVMNERLGADFDPDAFSHVAFWNAQESRIEMWLRAEQAMNVWIRDISMRVSLDEGESIRTEISTKFRPGQLEAELEAIGFEPSAGWTTQSPDFSLLLARVP